MLRTVIADYTREAGVRQLERELGTLLRKTATKIAAGARAGRRSTIDADAVRDALGRPKFFQEAAARTAVPGVATGLAVTGTGGDVLFVEAAAMAGRDGLVLTGQLGDVMKESARIALTYVRSHAAQLGIDEQAFRDREFHVHVPAGAIPKDGPSAGVTIVTALASLLTGRPVKHTVGMTGEVTLQGRVLPIGGVKQKVLAAHAAGPDRRHPPGAQRRRPRRGAGGGARADAVPPGGDRSTRCWRSRSSRRRVSPWRRNGRSPRPHPGAEAGGGERETPNGQRGPAAPARRRRTNLSRRCP